MNPTRWLCLVAGNAALAGWSWAVDPRAALAVVLVEGVLVAAVANAADATLAEHDKVLADADATTEEAAAMLAEVLAEHGPVYCDPSCDCSACRAARWLTAYDPTEYGDAPWWTRA